jgi:hypothetical protein
MVSTDKGYSWDEMNTFSPAGEDIRDPKFAAIGNRLFLYALKNTSFVAEPYITVYSYTEDGKIWTNFEVVSGLDGWLFWRPKTQDGIIYYNAAFWYQHGKSALLKSSDGISWEIISTIHEGGGNDETEIQFLPDESLLATTWLEYGGFADGAFGDIKGATLITVSAPPYTEWIELCRAGSLALMGHIYSPITSVFTQPGATSQTWVSPACFRTMAASWLASEHPYLRCALKDWHT